MSAQKKVVIYTRSASDMQTPRRCMDQERKVRDALERMGINGSEALVIHDKAKSGTKACREASAQLVEMVDRKEISILAVYDLARLTRTDNALAFITGLVNSGGRFISIGDGIDTSRPSWEPMAKVLESMNYAMIRNPRKRVRRS